MNVSPTEFWTAIITVICVQVGSILVKLYSMYLEAQRAAEVAKKVEQVNVDLKSKIEHNTQITQDVHDVVSKL